MRKNNAFKQDKRFYGKGLSYFIINGGFAIFFLLALLGLGHNDCHAVRGSNSPVDPALYPDSTDVKTWFNSTILLGFVFYTLAAISSLGYIMRAGLLSTISAYTEKVARLLTYAVFICVHIMRLSHVGKVCSGDYVHEDADSEGKTYMMATGNFFMTYIFLGWTVVPIMLIVMICIKGDQWAALALDAPK